MLWAQNQTDLPDIGSSAGQLLTPAQERAYGGMMLRQLRGYELVLDDPLLDGYLQNLGYRLASRSDRPRQPFTFFLMRDRQINAFATIGGYIGVNAGLILTAEREDELAAVLSHEISHVTQRHVLRAVEQAQRDQIPIMLGMLGAILAASQSGNGDGVQAAILGGMSLMQQRQINYTRSNEYEADRIGIQTLSRSGYEPIAMADFFARMERQMRGNKGGEQAPEYLRSHPVSTTRISEAKSRAHQIAETKACTAPDSAAAGCKAITLSRGINNPLLPDYVADAIEDTPGSHAMFDMARERLRVLSATTPTDAVHEMERLRDANPSKFSPAQRYGLALAHSLAGKSQLASKELTDLHTQNPASYWIELAQAENDHRAGNRAAARERYETMLREYPQNRAIVLSYANSLAELGTPEAARTAQELLRPLLADEADDAVLQRSYARACEVAGDTVRAAEAYAELAWLNGRADDALSQLERLRKTDDLDFYQRSRIDARIAAITPDALELRRENQRAGSAQLDATLGFGRNLIR